MTMKPMPCGAHRTMSVEACRPSFDSALKSHGRHAARASVRFGEIHNVSEVLNAPNEILSFNIETLQGFLLDKAGDAGRECEVRTLASWTRPPLALVLLVSVADMKHHEAHRGYE